MTQRSAVASKRAAEAARAYTADVEWMQQTTQHSNSAMNTRSLIKTTRYGTVRSRHVRIVIYAEDSRIET
jgi:hypothetical protein